MMIMPAIGGFSLFLASTGIPATPLPPPASDQPAVTVEAVGSPLGWPGYLGSGVFTSCLSAQMQPDPYPDGFAVRGGTLVHLPKLGFFSSFVPLREGVSDMAAITGGGIVRGTDALVTTGKHGLESYAWDAQSGALHRHSIDARSMLGSQVRAGDLDGDGQAEILVLDANAGTMHIYAGRDHRWRSLGSLAFGGLQVLDFDLARFDALAGMELVLGLEDGIEIHAVNLEALASAPLHSLRGSGARRSKVETVQDHAAPDVDGVAWAYRVPGEDRWAIATLCAQGLQPPTLLPEGLGLAGLSSGVLDGRIDGGADLAISVDQGSAVHLLRNQGLAGGESAFSWETGRIEAPTNWSAPDGQAQALLADLDGDLLAELVVGNAAAADLEIHYGVAPLPSLAGGSDLSWAWPQELGTWLFADDNSSLPAPDFSAIYGGIYSSQDIDTSNSTPPGTAMTASVWVSVPSAGMTPEPFLPRAIGHCDQVSSVLVDPASGLHSIALPVDSLAPFNPLVAGDLIASHRVFGVLVHPTTPFPNGAQPGVLMAMGAFPDTPTSGAQLFHHPYIVVRPGLTVSDVRRISLEEESNSSGVGIIVDSVPVRRIKTPPGVPPHRPAPECPDVGDGPGASGS